MSDAASRPTPVATGAPVVVSAQVFASEPIVVPVTVAPQAVASVVTTTPASIDLPDILDGGARRRRATLLMLALAALGLFGSIALTIASQYRPI